MAVKKGIPPKVDFPIEDGETSAYSAIRAANTELYPEMEKGKNLTKAQIKKRKLDKQRNKKTYDLSDELILILEMYAEEIGTTKSQVLEYLADSALANITEEFEPNKRQSKSMRFDYMLNAPEIPKRLIERAKKKKKYDITQAHSAGV